MKFGNVLACVAVALAFASPAFSEDAYIENTNGNQYFNTGHFIGPHTRIEIDLQLLEITGQIRMFGVDGGDNVSHPYCELYLGQAVTDGQGTVRNRDAKRYRRHQRQTDGSVP